MYSKYRKVVSTRPEVRFASLLSGEFTTMAVINPLEKKLAKPLCSGGDGPTVFIIWKSTLSQKVTVNRHQIFPT